jgi:transcription termination factor NusB
MINSKTIARLACAQSLFIYEYEERLKNFQEITDFIVSYYCASDISEDFRGHKVVLHKNYFLDLSNLLFTNLSAIDERLTYIVHEKTDILNLVILKVGLCEILYCNAAPTKVIVSEFSNISAAFGLNPALINSVLDKFGASMNQNRAEI